MWSPFCCTDCRYCVLLFCCTFSHHYHLPLSAVHWFVGSLDFIQLAAILLQES